MRMVIRAAVDIVHRVRLLRFFGTRNLLAVDEIFRLDVKQNLNVVKFGLNYHALQARLQRRRPISRLPH